MIYELRTYTLLPGRLGDYLKLAADAADAEREVFGANNDKFGKLEGQWYTELRRDTWQVIDSVVAGIFLISIFIEFAEASGS